jgi:cysteine desulfurase
MSKKATKRIYLDHSSSAPLDRGVFLAMKEFLVKNWANAGTLHKEGVRANEAIEDARLKIAKILGSHKDEIIFTSGGSEGNNLAILGIIALSKIKLPHIITTNIEHSSVLEVCRYLERMKKAKVTYIPVEPNGIVDSRKIKNAINVNTVLISVIYANNEIGTIMPIMEIAKEIRHHKKIHNTIYPYFHSDAAQAMNYLPVRVDKLGVDCLSFNGSKIYGPKGTGVLFKKRGLPLEPIMFGGDQEFGLRPGTENIAGMVGLGLALEITEGLKEKESKRLIVLRDYFINLLSRTVLDSRVLINGDLENRLPNNVNISVPGIESDLLVLELDAHGIAVSSKSACKSDNPEDSYVIRAIRPNAKREEGSIRFSLGRSTNKADIEYTIKVFHGILAKLKKWYN